MSNYKLKSEKMTTHYLLASDAKINVFTGRLIKKMKLFILVVDLKYWSNSTSLIIVTYR